MVFALATIGQAIASSVAHKFGVAILFLAAIVKSPYMAIAVLFLGILLEFSRVLNEGIIQREVPSHQRATIGSANSFISNLIPLQLAFGFIAGKYFLQWSYAFLGLFTLTYFIFLPFLTKLRRAKENNTG